MSSLFDRILQARGLNDPKQRQAFLSPDYNLKHDPFLLPDMKPAVDRLELARQRQQKVFIYGDYDIDGLTATALLLDALGSFGFQNVEAFIPNRFKEGYGLTVEAVEEIAAKGADLIITVDCGSLSTAEIERANSLGVDVIVTDHHNVLEVQPPAVAVINPKRLLMEHPEAYDNYRLIEVLSPEANRQLYPFLDLPGVGVAFKLVQGLQTRLEGLPDGHEKWLLDLVALGTVCDVVSLCDENRCHVYWGLRVLARTRRPGLKALMAVAGVDAAKPTARDLGFGLGPRMNAAGRLETAQHALDMLITKDSFVALEKAQLLDRLNLKRRQEQDKIFTDAKTLAEDYEADPVLVLSAPDWSHGIIGIVAAKLLEKYAKPTFVLEEVDAESKGSARSYGDFNAAEAIQQASDLITKGGGHKFAAGVTLPTENIPAFRKSLNNYYKDQQLEMTEQQAKLLPVADATAKLSEVDEGLVEQLGQLEPFGHGNPAPILKTGLLRVVQARKLGDAGQHLKLTLADGSVEVDFIAFSAPGHFFVEPGESVTVWYQPEINEWRNRRSIQGRLVRLEVS